MTKRSDRLSGKMILLLEDEYFLADELSRALRNAGAEIIGPYSDLSHGMAAIESRHDVTCAVLDINLSAVLVYPLAEALRRRGIPFVFTTGYDRDTIPLSFQDVPRCEKPVHMASMVNLLATM